MIMVLLDIVLTLVMLAAVVITCIVLLPARRTHRHRPATPGVATTGHRPTTGPLTRAQLLASVPAHDMSDQELSRAWRLSHDLLGRSTRPGERAELVALRQSYLDEFEQRHPTEFARWLHDNPTPADDIDRRL
ncbi:hypothetical protein [Microlunatus sp. Y2014]|uniref:hypothetical protein n=1 Tax=Microlunatus sp. Y2014 TaxID=3418488 RepID=UPI003DA72D24